MAKDPAERAEGALPESRPTGSGQPVIVPALSYTQKVLIAVGVSAAAILLAALLFYTAQIMVLLFAAVLFAVFLSAPSNLLAKQAHLGRGYALGIVLLSLVTVVLGGGYFMGSTIVHQAEQMARTVPLALGQFERDLTNRLPEDAPDAPATAPGTATAPTAAAATGEAAASSPATTAAADKPHNWLAEKIIQARQAATDFLFSESFVRRAGGVAGGVVSSTFGFLAGMVVIFGVGLFFAINPRLYTQGLVRLAPVSRRARTTTILAEVGTQLQWWFVGQMCSMATVGLLTFVGLKMLGMPMAVTLAILAGLLNFVPNFGPIIAAVPAVLIAFAPEGDHGGLRPALAGWTLLTYMVIQMLDGWVMTPFFQQRAVSLPPALIIVSQVVFALLLGPIGLILASPILATVLVVVRMVYVEDVLGDRGKG